MTASKLALEQVLQTTKLFIRICSKFEVNHKGGESHHDANPIAMRILSRCESHCDVNPIAMRIPSWWESNLDLNLIIMLITILICNKSKNEMNPEWLKLFETCIGILVFGKDFSRGLALKVIFSLVLYNWSRLLI